MALVYAVALVVIATVYLFVSAGSSLWPGGPQLQPEASRNLSISLILVGLLLCGLLFGSFAESLASGTQPTRMVSTGGGTAARATPSPQLPASGGVTASPTRAPAAAASLAPTATTESSAVTSTPSSVPSLTPSSTPSSTPTATLSALPPDPQVLVETVLLAVIERANDAHAEAILSGDGGALDPWWSGPARDRALDGAQRIRSRFLEVLSATWAFAGDGIQLLTSSAVSATYTTNETWTFIGTLRGQCPDGAPLQQRFVESYASEQYTLELRDGVLSVAQWALGRPVTLEARSICP